MDLTQPVQQNKKASETSHLFTFSKTFPVPVKSLNIVPNRPTCLPACLSVERDSRRRHEGVYIYMRETYGKKKNKKQIKKHDKTLLQPFRVTEGQEGKVTTASCGDKSWRGMQGSSSAAKVKQQEDAKRKDDRILAKRNKTKNPASDLARNVRTGMTGWEREVGRYKMCQSQTPPMELRDVGLQEA